MVPFQTLVEKLGVGVTFVNPDYRIEYCNEAEARLRGLPREQIVGRSILDCHTPESRAKITQLMEEFRSGATAGFVRMRSGREQFVEQKFAPLFDASGAFLGMVLLSIDVTALETSRRRFETLATRDELTGLFNRNHFLAIFTSLAGQLRPDSPSLALIVADINGLKAVNDTLGHWAGDELIKQAADVLRTTVRETDFIFRFGGDEFAALLPAADERAAEAVRRRIKKRCRRERPHPSLPPLRVGVGWAVARTPEEADRLFALADAAMYQDKAKEKRKLA